MAIESAFNFITDLDPSYPLYNDGLVQADDHMRGIKSAIKGSFLNFTGVAVTATEAELNVLDGILASTSELNLLQSKSLASTDDVIDNFPSGTLMLFQQTAAPTGWTKAVSHNNKALRVVSGTAGSGGSNSFSSRFNSAFASNGHVLSQSQIPVHQHGSGSLTTSSSGNHTHSVDGVTGGTGSSTGFINSTATNSDRTTSTDGAHTHTISGNTGYTGGGSSHSHNITIDVQYVDVIIASKD